MILTYYGHSAVQIDLDGTVVLIDPFITGNKWTDGVVSAGELSPDVILLTHAHGDHWGDTPEIASRSGALVVGTFEVVQYLSRKFRYENGKSANTGGRVYFDWGSVLLTQALHSSSFPDGTYGGSPNGFLIEAGDNTVYHAGDTSAFPDMQWLGDSFDIDVAFIPIGDCFTMGPEDSLRAIEYVKPTKVVPVHYDTFPPIQLSGERKAAWERSVRELGVEPVILGAGQTLEL